MAASFEVELATIGDLDTLVTQWVDLVEGQREFGSHLLGAENSDTARDVLGQYIAGDHVAVARPTDADQWQADVPPIIGFVMFYVEDGLYEQDVSRGIIENLYVVPDARENGVGSALMTRAESALADRGAAVAALSVMAANQVGRDFYEDRGYDPHRVVFERPLDADSQKPQETSQNREG